MNEPRDRASAPDVVCRVCGKEVPRSAARTAEGRDYTYFFCGAGCQQQWAANQQAKRGTAKPGAP